MRAAIAQFRRAPGRIIASVIALAFAVGAIGVFAIPSISGASLREAVAQDGVADIVMWTTPLGQDALGHLSTIDGIEYIEAEIDLGITLPDGSDGSDGTDARLVGLALGDQQMDIVHLTDGRMPTRPDEVVASPGMGSIGDSLTMFGRTVHVVGHGATLWWAAEPTVYADLDAVRAVAPGGGTNRLVVTATDDGIDELRAISTDVREALAATGAGFVDFPVYLPDGKTPIDQDIEQVSGLIGLLGVVAGMVALVLLASTTNTLVSERTREVAVMRALGGRSRQLRRRLRRIALTITVVALAIGLPLGVVISNTIARLVLEEFVGLTPDVGVDWRVLVASAAGMLVGARLVSGRAARRVVRAPLAEALRDREGAPFGRRWFHRLIASVGLGGLSTRLAMRAAAHRPARTIAVVAQVSAAVGATFLIASLATSVTAYNDAALAPWSWASMTQAQDPGLPIETADVDPRTGEAAIYTWGETGGWEVDVYGLTPDTAYFDPSLAEGEWLAGEGSERQAVVSVGFAERNDIAVGDLLPVEIAAGPVDYRIVGLSDDHSRTLYVDRDTLADDMSSTGMANVVFTSAEAAELDLGVATSTITAAELAEESGAGRDAIVMVFGAIGVVVAGVAAVAVVSSMTVSLFQRRHELAAMQALGARRRRLRGVVAREMVPIGVVGLAAGLGLGALGSRAVIASFEASNAVDIGVVDATGALPVIVVATLVGLLLLSMMLVRGAARRPITVTLRGAA